MFPYEGQDTLNDLVSPSAILDYAERSDPLLQSVECINPVHNYIAPDLVNLYVANTVLEPFNAATFTDSLRSITSLRRLGQSFEQHVLTLRWGSDP